MSDPSTAPAPAPPMLQQLQKSIDKCKSLGNDLFHAGYSVLDDAFDHEFVLKLRDDVELLENGEWLEPSSNKLQMRSGQVVRVKPNVFERSLVLNCELSAGEATMSMVPSLASFWNERNSFLTLLSSKTGIQLSMLEQIKIASIHQGGAFMVHTDNLPCSQRILTMTLYLGVPREDYSPVTHGGQLRLYPLQDGITPCRVDINPIAGRAVFFSSNNVPHRVLPSKCEKRYCISMFFRGFSMFPVYCTPKCTTPTESCHSFLNTWRNSSGNNLQNELALLVGYIKDRYPDVCAAVHSNEYELSILESFSAGRADEDVLSALEEFRLSCDKYEKNLPDYVSNFVEAARVYVGRTDALVIS